MTKFLRNKDNGHLFPYNVEHASREYFETVEIPEKLKTMPDMVIEEDSQNNPPIAYESKPKRVSRRKFVVPEGFTDVSLGDIKSSTP